MKKVIVAMSGGVDSSVAALLLKRAGFDVSGVFLKLASLSSFKESEKRAKKVAKLLEIPFLVLDLRKEFKRRIIDYFLREYEAGRTPNPCVVCNKEIKFGLLLEKALKLGADYLATGHYARLRREIPNSKSQILNYRYKLLRGKDKTKDQSYFLWQLNQNQLRKILFPIGNYTRREVEKLAKKFKLPALKARKSVEICFIQTTINDFLKRYLGEKPGQIIDTQRKIIDQHRGLWFYTIGQRKGIGLAGGPYYVLDKDFKKNLLIVTKKEKDLYKKELVAKNVNWLSGRIPKLPLKVKAKIRYKHEPAEAQLTQIYPDKKTDLPRFLKVEFTKSQRAITPGQSVVFYKGQELLGGGIIA